MKAKTKIDKDIVSLSHKLKPLTLKELKYLKVNLADRLYMISRNRIYCSYCGHKDIEDRYKKQEDNLICPVCRSSLKRAKYLREHDGFFVSRTLLLDKYQVVQNFEITEIHKKGLPVKLYWQTLNAFFILPNGKWSMISKLISRYNLNANHASLLEPRKKNTKLVYVRHFTSHVFNKGIHPLLKRNGLDIEKFNANTKLKAFNRLCIDLFTDNNVEYLLKVEQWEILHNYLMEDHIKGYLPEIKIVIRHNYTITDIKMWCDYIDLLEYFNKDLHSPYYLCPANLKEVHDRYVIKKRKEERAKDLAEQNAKIETYNSMYIERLGKLLSLKFENQKVVIEPFKNVYQFRDLGERLKLCIYENQYFNKNNILLFTAIDKKEQKTEVLAVNLEHISLSEIRGYDNEDSVLKPAAVRLIAKHKKEIKAICKTQFLT